VKYRANTFFSAAPPSGATFAAPLLAQVSFYVQPDQCSVPEVDGTSACQAHLEEWSSVTVPQEQATNAEDDASQQAQDTIDGDVVNETNMDKMISVPLKHVSVDSTEAFSHSSVQDGHSVALPSALADGDFSFVFDVPCALKALDDVHTDVCEELVTSMIVTAPLAHEHLEEDLDDNTIRYCLAIKIQARRQVTGSATKCAEFHFISSSKSDRANNVFFKVLFYTASAPSKAEA
jgi:hypothetical protein